MFGKELVIRMHMKALFVLFLFVVVAQAQITLQHQVLSVYPPQNATSVPIHDSLVVQFAPELNILPQSLSDTTFVIQASQSGWHRGVVTYDPQTHAATIKPVKPFFVGELVTAVATKKIQYDSAGVIKNIRGFAWQFWGKVTTQTHGTISLKQGWNVPGGVTLLETVSDIDNDGWVDLGVFSNDSDRIYFNSGNGIDFAEIGLPRPNGDLVSYNFAGSNYQDLWAGGHTFFKNIDGRHFEVGTYRQYGFANPFIISFDVDNDGTPDLFGKTGDVNGDTMLVLFLKDSVISRSEFVVIPNDPNWAGYPCALDANNDGALDIVVGTTSGYMLLLNDGNGSLLPPVRIGTGGTLACGDFDGDGWADILTVDIGYTDLLHNNGDGTFTDKRMPQSLFPLQTDVYGLAVGDFDGDGSLDAIFTAQQEFRSGDSIYLASEENNGNGMFHFAQVWSASGGGSRAYLKAADLNGDGALDLVMGYTDIQSVLVFHNDSSVPPLVGVEQGQTIVPTSTEIIGVFPDPATNTAIVQYRTPDLAQIEINVYDESGKRQFTILHGAVFGTNHQATFSSASLPNGSYLVELIAGNERHTKSFIVLH
jgi:hypothetical protein